MHPSTFSLATLGLLTALTASPPPAVAQSGRAVAPNLWHEAPAARTALAGSAWDGRLKAYRPVAPDVNALKAVLASAPLEGTPGLPVVLTLPTPDGGTARFRIVEAPVMEAPLAARYPQIKTYAGIGLDDPTATLRADLTPLGFHAQVLSRRAGATFYLDPVNEAAPQNGLISYWRQDLRPNAGQAKRPACQVLPVPANERPATQVGAETKASVLRPQTSLGTTLRTYRLAVAATGEYTAARGGSVASALAAMTVSVNRVTGVYEKELGVRMVLVANTNLVIYTNANTDPYNNNDGGAMLGQNQTTLTSVIGAANYDIGHVFSTGGGGVAALGSVCVASRKAQGVTGSPNPVGDAFDIDYVAHEMGHQFGGNHPFNGNSGSCSGGNRNGSTAWEPGSGSTIMAYAGICDGSGAGGTGSSQDLQSNSDAYFHGGNISEMASFINTTTCVTPANSGNTPPAVTTPGNKSIPARTPFRLTATATDAENDALTYDWEEMDLGAQGAPVTATTTQTANATIPLFRSLNPLPSPTRYFPRLNELRNNTTIYGEALPTVARAMAFRCTVRDQHFSTPLNRIVGGVNQTNTVTLTVVNTGAAFAVTAPNTALTWNGGTTQTVTWNVAGTTANNINCANVDILLSTDGGLTFPTTLATGVPNSGTAAVVVPAGAATTQARVMVAGAGNYFFDISNVNFSITASATAPVITSFSPASGQPGTIVTITGVNLNSTSSIRFNGTLAPLLTINSPTSITVTVPAGATTGLITLVTPVGTAASATAFVVPSAPTISGLNPTSGVVGTSVTVTGTDFTGITSLTLNGVSVPFVFVNNTTVTFVVPAGGTTGAVTVSTPLGTATGPVFTVPATPTNDLCSATVPLLPCNGSVLGTTTLSTSIGDPTAACNAVTIEPASGGVFYRFIGTGGSVTLSTCDAATTFDTKLFVYTGSCANLVCVTANDDVTCTPRQYASSLTFTSVTGTTYYVFVSGYNGATGDFRLTSTSTLCSAVPTITSFTPITGPAGTLVTITGANLTGATGVTFGGAAATAFTVVSATSITVTVPAGANTGPIGVTTAGGTATSTASFTVTGSTRATLANYDFNAGTSFAALTPATAPGITAAASSSEAFATLTGIATTAAAFAQNQTAGNALSMSNSSGTNTRYFQFALGGTSLPLYSDYKVYAQTQRAATGATTVTLAYSLDGGTTFTAVAPSGTVATTYNALAWDLGGIVALNRVPAVVLRVLASGASGTGTLRLDNFQVQASTIAPRNDARPLGTGAVVSTASLALWPNPAHTSVSLSGADARAAVRILDLAGRTLRMVTADAAGEATLSLNGLPAGIYLVRTGAATQRLVVE